ncbi:SNARE domain-containing protein [Pseudovirgaria hyperparasitica]|uniref:SNARE domain-containing protein n=1 Tax=Pseudovirgaria hyperparasitica TaxID=470096 RepID=A0A6A6VXX3_9PEZI|nr:SNARE domain-containing protein [Pseudovirgaria hyperparasitica]KAF2755462.1 SNARE domain-containing protein [Pseudovirgaria hyperparasitica]
MASRFNSNLHERSSRSSLFGAYDERAGSQSPGGKHVSNGGYGYGLPANSSAPAGGAFSAYPGANGGLAAGQQQFRSATPNSRGQYSSAVLDELESQNNDQMEGMGARVKMLKDLTMAIGDEIRDSSALAEKMNESFEGTRQRLRGTMNRMLRMADKTGVGWRVWLMFFAAVSLLFWYVWLF